MVECEYHQRYLVGLVTMVLIDTWWNVNPVYRSRMEFGGYVLIDTWWNVNSSFLTPFPSDLFVLIDTWWNVNDYQRFPYVTKQWF